MNPVEPRTGRFDAIAFDLLTALLDSWSLWISVAGQPGAGRAWRRASLRLVTTAGAYRPYEYIVAEAAREVSLPAGIEHELLRRWLGGGLRPWPEVTELLATLRSGSWRTCVVTNCSQSLAEKAAEGTGHRFDEIVSAERAGVYKTDPRAYRAGLAAIGMAAAPERVLFVAGSAHDIPGARAVGMPVYWSNRFDDGVPEGAQPPLRIARDLTDLPKLLLS